MLHVAFDHKGMSGECPCSETEGHSEHCQCNCKHCKSARFCSCTAGHCLCPAICNCWCDYCHTDLRSVNKCTDCGKAADLRGGRHKCPSCANRDSAARRSSAGCLADGCENAPQSKIAWCSTACYPRSTHPQSVRMCNNDRCSSPAPPGTGLTCQPCYKQGYTEKQRKKSGLPKEKGTQRKVMKPRKVLTDVTPNAKMGRGSKRDDLEH